MKSVIFIFALITAGFSQPPAGSISPEEAAIPKKGVKKIWKNCLKAYNQARNTAKIVVRQMELTSNMAHAMQNMIISWENVAKTSTVLFSKKRWSDIMTKNPVHLIENLEEKFFRESDYLLLKQIPSAINYSRDYSNSREKWIRGFKDISPPVYNKTKEHIDFLVESTRLSKIGIRSKSEEKIAHEARTRAMAGVAAKGDIVLTQNENHGAQIKHLQEKISNAEDLSGDDGLVTNYQIGETQTENEYQIQNLELTEKMSAIEMYSQIQLTRSSKYANSALLSYMAIGPMVEFSESLKKIYEEME